RGPAQPSADPAVGARHQPQPDAEPGLVMSRVCLLALAVGVACPANGRAPGEPGPEPPHEPSGPAAQVWLTTPDGSKLLSRESDAHFDSGPAPSITTIAVDEATTYQEMVGFGAAITDASAWLIQNKLTPSQSETLLQELFGRNPGIGLSFTRLTMGASDFSLRQYSYDDLPAGQTDPTLAQFSIDANRADVLPVVQRALAINHQLKIMASPWSAPGWMKTSGSLIQGTLLPEAYGPFAEYLRRYIAGGAWHCYAGDVSAQTLVHDAHADKDAYFTECSGGGWAPNFADNLKWFVRTLIIGSTRGWAKGVLLWNLVLDEHDGPHTGGCGNCRGVVTINSASGGVTRNVEYYALAHASRFVRPGARRV